VDWHDLVRSWTDVDVCGRALALPRCDVGEHDAVVVPQATVLVNVPEQMPTRSHDCDALEEIDAAGTTTHGRSITKPRGWRVRDQDVDAVRNLCPHGSEFAPRGKLNAQ
jgi:hypothetical protein